MHRASLMNIILRLSLLVSVRIAAAKPIQTLAADEDFLSQYGYLPSQNSASLSLTTADDNETRRAVMASQTLYGADVTGELDSDTKNLMSSSRFGDKDKLFGKASNYVLWGQQHNMNVTYRIKKYSRHLEKKTVDEEIKKAFEMWSEHTDLRFTQKREEPVDIEIRFDDGTHIDCGYFDGPGGVLAHALKPFIHFDDAETWTVTSERGTNLLQIAVHEIGHSLGLDDSHFPSSVMYTRFLGYDPSFRLYVDDIQGIQGIYGPKTKGEHKQRPRSSEEGPKTKGEHERRPTSSEEGPKTKGNRQRRPTSSEEGPKTEGEHQRGPTSSEQGPKTKGNRQRRPTSSEEGPKTEGEHQRGPTYSEQGPKTKGEHKQRPRSSEEDPKTKGEHQRRATSSEEGPKTKGDRQRRPTSREEGPKTKGEYQRKPMSSEADSEEGPKTKGEHQQIFICSKEDYEKWQPILNLG